VAPVLEADTNGDTNGDGDDVEAPVDADESSEN
jgi:hypothetical protein